MHPQAEIQVIVGDLVRFIEAAEPLEHAPPHQHAGTGHGDDVALRQVKAEITRIVTGSETERMPAYSVILKKHPGVLDLAVAIQKLWSNKADVRPLRMFQ